MDLPIQVDRDASQSLQRQVTEQLRRAILDGRLATGTRLPSTRVLAAEIGISRNVALAAYDELFAEGYVEGRHGSGTFVATDLPLLPRPSLPAPPGAPRWLRPQPEIVGIEPPVDGEMSFRLGRPDTSQLPPDVWRRIWNDVAAQRPPADYGSPAGIPELRDAVAAYLRRSRGVACSADDVVITGGAIQALDLIARGTLIPGDRVGIEEPGYPTARQALVARGAQLLPMPVDDDGLRVDTIPTGPDAPLLVYVTPSHQYPLGARMPVARRMALIEWARENDGLIIEDDYDSEFRFDAPPLPALAGLDDAGRVAYIGTFSKVLSPALRAGYVVAPAPLRERLELHKRLSDYHTPWPLQKALATFVSNGYLERHIRRMRRHYAEKRAALRSGLVGVASRAHLRGLEAGLHVFLELDPALDTDAIVAEAARRGVIVGTLDEYYGDPSSAREHGLLLGYGGLTIAEVQTGSSILAEIIGGMAAGHDTTKRVR
jgi:GntR family transcriptional regulator / MocR family aminotransferase